MQLHGPPEPSEVPQDPPKLRVVSGETEAHGGEGTMNSLNRCSEVTAELGKRLGNPKTLLQQELGWKRGG